MQEQQILRLLHLNTDAKTGEGRPLKILMVDKYYFIKGGAERYYFELSGILTSKSHEIIPFSMQHPDNFRPEYENYFVENIEFNGISGLRKLSKTPEILARVIYSTSAKKAISKLIEKVKPDIAHIHMIDHQLSPSILHAFRDHNIPVMQTCHQYKLICPSYRLFVMHKNQVCEKCISGKNYHAVFEKCHKNSVAASAVVAAESYIHRWMKIYDLIDVFHVPSKFLRQKLIEGGFPEEKIWHNFYTINLNDYPFHLKSGDYCIYYGRLSEEKGVLTLLNAMCRLPEAKLLIAGDGPQRTELENFAREKQLNRVQFVGNKNKKEITRLVQNAKFVVVPSEWHDNSPLVIYESFSMGKPVIVSEMGGMPELVDHEINGLHFKAGDVDGLSASIQRLWHDIELCKKMGIKAREKADREFSPEAHYENIIKIYNTLLGSKQRVQGKIRINELIKTAVG